MKQDDNALGTGKRASFTAAPRSIVCVGCNGQYFASSLPIHQRLCFERNAFVSVACPKCRTTIKTGIYHAHVSTCTSDTAAGSDDDAPARLDARDTLSRRHERNNPPELNTPEADGRIRCKCCDRAFHEDRIAKHQSVCVGQPPSRTSDRSKIGMGKSCLQAKSGRPESIIPTSSIRSLAGPCRNPITPKDSRARASLPAGVCHGVAGWTTQQRPVCFTRDGDTRRYDMVIRDSGRQVSFGSTNSNGSGHPGASRMQAGRWEGNSNASSAGNPLVTNRMMTVSSVGESF